MKFLDLLEILILEEKRRLKSEQIEDDNCSNDVRPRSDDVDINSEDGDKRFSFGGGLLLENTYRYFAKRLGCFKTQLS